MMQDTAPASNNKENLRPASGQSTLSNLSGAIMSSGGVGGGQQPAAGRQHKLKQRFTVIRKLGKGTYGKVQLAINKQTGQEVAIKTIKKSKIENEQDLERVRREIQIMSSIEHPHIIHIYEVFENKDKIVLIMQYAPGGELYEHVSQAKLLDDQEARRLFRQIAAAIFYCHENKICHRDLKLENILLDEKRNAKIADFGLSNVFDSSQRLKTFCGSPLYASPEIVQGSPYEGPEVDCWSLGVLLYTLVYGSMPFDGTNFKRLVRQISQSAYYEPEQRSGASPLIGRLLCADPKRRATIRDICLDSWVNGANLGGQQPALLLKVAQDMAKLTPVRLDILLALTPQQQAIAPPAAEQQQPECDVRMHSPVSSSFVVRDVQSSSVPAQADRQTTRPPEGAEAEQKLDDEDERPEVRSSASAGSCATARTATSQIPVEAAIQMDTEEAPNVNAQVESQMVVVADEPEVELVEAPAEPMDLVATEPQLEQVDEETQITKEESENKLEEEKVAETKCDIEAKDKQPEEKVEPRDGDAQTQQTGDEKPKKVRKKVVVVRKVKKKVAKKVDGEANEEEQQKQQQVATSVGRVKIPETFKSSGESEQQQQQQQQQRATRRQSALVADVSHKLLQQQNQQQQQQPTQPMDEAERQQLAKVRVSDKKEEFERRLSLAAASEQPPASCKQSDETAASKKPKLSAEPVRVEGRREFVCLVNSVATASVEPARYRSSGPVRVGPAAKCARLPAPPPPPLDSPKSAADENLLFAADSQLERRSDSVETIRAELSPRADEHKNIRTSLEVKLNLAPAADPLDSGRSVSPASATISGRPVPIARSYKKVTFRRDGSCITETGRIYSTQADDGTMRRVERRSKVTHYATDQQPFGSQDQQTAAPAGRSFASQRLERLILPASDLSANELPDDLFGFSERRSCCSSTSSSQRQRAKRSSFGRADSASSCSSASTDVFDDIFDSTWTGGLLGSSLFARPQRSGDKFSETICSAQRRSKLDDFCSGASTARCGSVEPEFSFAGFRAPDTRPSSGSMLTSARGSKFGSSSFFSETLNQLEPLERHDRLLQEFQLEHSRLRHQMAKRQRQFWRTSALSLLEQQDGAHERQPEPRCTPSPLRMRSSSGSSSALPSWTPLDRQQESSQRQQQSSSSKSDCLPPRYQAATPIRRTSSRTSALSQMLSSMQISSQVSPPQPQPPPPGPRPTQYAAANFIQLNRDPTSSSSSSSSPANRIQKQQANRVTTSANFVLAQPDESRRKPQPAAREPTHSADTDPEARIQNWLQQSAGNLSISSGSKSSAASDLLASGSSRSDMAQDKVVLSRAQLPPAPLTMRRSPVDRQQCRQVVEKTSTILQRSSSKQSLGDQPSQQLVNELQQSSEFSEITRDERQHSATTTTTTCSSATINKSKFNFLSSSTSRKPAAMGPEQVHWIKSSSKVFSDDLDLDLNESLSGAEVESHSSSSLLEQLRSRGYDSMMSQRLATRVSPLAQQQQQHQQRQPQQQAASSSCLSSSSQLVTSTSSATSLTSGTTQFVTKKMVSTINMDPIPDQEDTDLQATPEESSDRNHTETNGISTCDGLQEAPVGQPTTVDELNSNEAPACLSETNQSDEEDDDDEDIRRAKANLKCYLDRVKETEMFLKSMQENEENLERKRRESFLFNSMVVNTRLNRFHKENEISAASHFSSTSNPIDSPPAAKFYPDSAPPILAMNNYVNPTSNESFKKGSSSFETQPFATGDNRLFHQSEDSRHLNNTDSYLSNTMSFGSTAREKPSSFDFDRGNQLSGGSSKGPRSSSFDYRVRSQFNESTSLRPAELASSSSAGHKPWSAQANNLENPYFTSTQLPRRRALSQVRYPGQSVLPLNADSSSMISEYRSSFKAHTRAISRSPVRSTRFSSNLDVNGDDSEPDGIDSYRASTYVSKFESAVCDSGRSGQAELHRQTWDQDRDFRPSTSRPSRRVSLQLTNSTGSPSRSPSRLASRHRSVSPTNKHSAPLEPNSRLSELEQRIQENKRRREELLLDTKTIDSPQIRTSGIKVQQSDSVRPEIVQNNHIIGTDGDDIDEEMEKFRVQPRYRRDSENSLSASRVVRSGDLDERSTCSRSIARPSRLDSMEARIKRRSYCVRMKSPERVNPRRMSASSRCAAYGTSSRDEETILDRQA